MARAEKKYLTVDEMVERFRGQISKKTLAHWRTQGTGPMFHRTGGRILYDLADVEEWEQKRRVSSTSQYRA